MRGLFESRIMSAAHIAAIYFQGRKEAAKKRLQTLKALNLVQERPRSVNEPSVLFLTRKGFTLLSDQKLLSSYPKLSAVAFEKRADVSPLTIKHELQVMDVKAAFFSRLAHLEKFSIVEFSTWPRLHEFRAQRSASNIQEALVKPDGFIRIHERNDHGGLFEYTFFLEVDRSTETQETLVNRATCYLDYYKSGGFALSNGAARSNYKDFPFRVLLVLKSHERKNNTARRLLENNPPIRTLAYLTTLEEVQTDPIGSIWIRPADANTKVGLFNEDTLTR